MRTLSNSAFTVNYPDDTIFSGDLNRLKITKNTTATHVELSFTISGYNYAENLYFFGTNPIEFSMSDILKLIFDRTVNTTFYPKKSFDFTLKLYNNTSLIEAQAFKINNVILGKRRVFDNVSSYGNVSQIDLDIEDGISTFYYYFPILSHVYIKYKNGAVDYFGSFQGYQLINLSGISGDIDIIYYNVGSFTDVFDETFQYTKIIYIASEGCKGNPNRFWLRFLNRFGQWRHYYIIAKSENINSDKGISLLFLENNTTELNNLFAEQKKSYVQSMSFYRDSLSKDVVNDFSDCIYSDHCHIYDKHNLAWLPVRVQTNTFNIEAKETLFDVSLNIILQANNE